MTVEVYKDGVLSMTTPAAVRADGSIWSLGSNPKPLINGFLLEKLGVSKEEYGKQFRAGRLSPEVLSCCLRLGDNPGGRVVVDKTAADELRSQEAEAAMTPADRERRDLLDTIARTEQQARRCDRSQDDEEFRRLTWKAEKLQKKFYEKFPADLRADRASRLRDKAENVRRIAAGAMLYDCDGSLSHDDQIERRDAGIREAEVLEAQAVAIETGGAA